MERLTARDLITGKGDGLYFDLDGPDIGDYLEEIQMAYDKLAAYEDAEEEGRLIEFPFKIGEKFYYVNHFGIFENVVDGYEIRNDGFDILSGEQEFDDSLISGESDEFIFRTRAEAEAKLKEMEGENVSDI